MEVQQQACKENLRDRPKVAFIPVSACWLCTRIARVSPNWIVPLEREMTQ